MLNTEALKAQEQEQKNQAALADATLEKGVYLKKDPRNSSLFIERSHKRLGSTPAARADETLKQLTEEELKQFNSKGAVKINAYVNKSEIVKITSWTE